MENAGNDIININVLTLNSQRYQLRVHKQILVSQLKTEIARCTGIPRAHQRLYYCGHRLSDDRTLSNYNIRNGHTLNLFTQQPNAASSSHDLNPPAPVSEEHAQFNTHFHGQGNTNFATQMISALISGFALNFDNNPEIRPENPLVMVGLLADIDVLRSRSSQRIGGGVQVAMAPSQQPLLNVLHSTNSLLTTLARSVYLLRFLITYQGNDPEMFQQRLHYYGGILRDQLLHSPQFLTDLRYLMDNILRQPAPSTMPQPQPQPRAENFPFQPERRGSWRRMRNDGASTSNSISNGGGTSSQDRNASEYVEDPSRGASVRPRDPRLNRRRRRDDE